MDIFVARQPIFLSNMKVYAYELLYRSSYENKSTFIDGDEATINVLNNYLMIFDEDRHKKSFVNFTKSLLLKEIPLLFPPDSIIIEILEDVIIDDEVIEVCKNLKSKGYILALDDYILSNENLELLNYIDIIKIDFIATSKSDRKEIIRRYKNYNIEFLAEKVETKEEFEEAKSLGYKYFQGYFFSKPTISTAKDIKAIPQNLIRLLNEINEIEPNYTEIATIIESDVALTYKLLKLVNSAHFGNVQKIRSVIQAIAFLGYMELRKWITMILIQKMSRAEKEEVLKLSLIRGKMLELISIEIGKGSKKSEYFIVGSLSLIDILLDMNIEEALKDIALSNDIKEAILGEKNNLYSVLSLVKDYEQTNWDSVRKTCVDISLDIEKLGDIYLEAIRWSNELAII